METRYAFILGFVLVTMPLSSAATISGRVSDERGAPIARAAVVWVGFSTPQGSGAVRRALSQPPVLIQRGSGYSDTGGRFETPDLRAADYQVCVTSLADQSHLSTCEWRADEAKLSVSDQPQTMNLIIRRGSVLKFRIADPKGRLARGTVSVIVSAQNRGFAHARVLTLTPSWAELYVAVPFNSRIAAVVDAPGPVRDAAGAPLPLRVPAMPMTVTNEPARDILLTLE